MGALENYLGQIEPLSGFAYGTTDALDLFKEARGTSGAGAAALGYALNTMRAAWWSLPPDIRKEALDVLSDAANDALGMIGEAGEGLGELVPLLNAVIGLVDDLMEAGKTVKKINEAFSLQDENSAQWRTFVSAQTPTEWIYAQVPGYLYMHYGGGTGDDRWRARPALGRVGRSMLAFRSLSPSPPWPHWPVPGVAPDPTGNCSPGKPYRSKSSGGWKAKDDSELCHYQAAFSALFYPWWYAGRAPEPLPYYDSSVWPTSKIAGEFRDPGVNPNAVLIERQVELLSRPKTNLQADGVFLRQMYENFKEWTAGSRETIGVKIDPVFIPASDNAKDPPAHFFFDANGLIYPYQEVARSEKYGASTRIALNYALPISIGMYNTVISMTHAFFTARSLFLQDQPTMKTFVDEGLVDTFDPSVRAAVMDAAVIDPSRPVIPEGLMLGVPEKPPSVHPEGIDPAVVRPARPRPAGRNVAQKVVVGALVVGGVYAGYRGYRWFAARRSTGSRRHDTRV